MSETGMSAEIRRLIDRAREAMGTFRDAAREGREIGFRQRDPLVIAIHQALDKLEEYALLPALPPDTSSAAPSQAQPDSFAPTQCEHVFNREAWHQHEIVGRICCKCGKRSPVALAEPEKHP